jgi:WD40 repeat protein/tRNA A-37 threonylcarbamoyl transferase component Bud32
LQSGDNAEITSKEVLADDDSFILLLDKYWPHDQQPDESLVDGGTSGRLPTTARGISMIGRFQIERELGRGGFGTVYLAHDPLLGHGVALKIPHPETRRSQELQRRFEREARAASSLDHPNINAIYETGKTASDLFIASHYCLGPTLADWLKQRRAPVSSESAAKLIATLAGAVQHAHDRGVLHRDLKPSNVLLERITEPSNVAPGEATFEGFVPRLSDFGLAKILDEVSDDTRTGLVLGTPRYMAPEQAAGRSIEIGPRTDVYALGVMLYELLVGRPPFVGDTELETLRQIRSEEPISIRRLQPKVPRELDIICMKCLEKEPPRRYASAGDLAIDLRRFLERTPISARPPSVIRRIRVWTRRRPAQTVVLAAGLMVLLGLPSGLIWHTMGLERAFHVAEQQRIRAEEFGAQARGSERLARANEATVQQHVYASEMRLANELLKQGDFHAVANLVDRHDPELASGSDRRGFEWWYLRRFHDIEKRSWPAHAGALSQLAFSADGRVLLTASFADQSAKTWEVPTGKLLTTVSMRKWVDERDNQVAAISPDGQLVATLIDNRTVGVWNAVTGAAVARLPDEKPVLCVAFSPDGEYLVAGGAERSTLWKCGQWHTAAGTIGSARLAVFSPDATTLATLEWSPYSHEVQLWDVATLKVKRTKTFWWPILDLAYTQDGRNIAVVAEGPKSTTIAVYNPNTGDMTTSMTSGDDRFRRLSLSADSKLLASASQNGSLHLWEPLRGQARGNLRGPSKRLSQVVFSPDGRSFAASMSDGSIGIWDQTLLGSPQPVQAAAPSSGPLVFAPHERSLAVADTDGGVMLVNASTGHVEGVMKGHVGQVTDIAFSSDGRQLATTDGGHLRCWDINDKWQLWSIDVEGAHSVAWSPSDKLLAVGGKQPFIRLFDVTTAAEVGVLEGHTGEISTVRFLPNGRQLASAGRDGTVRIWDLDARKEAYSPLAHDGPVLDLAVSSDGHLLAAGLSTNKLAFWKLAGGRAPEQSDLSLPWLAGYHSSIQFSPDSKAVAVCGLSGVLVAYDPVARAPIYGLSGRGVHPASLAYSSDGRLMAVVSSTNVLSLWDITTWTGRRVLGAPLPAVRALAFSADGRSLAVASDDSPGVEPQKHGYFPAPLTVHLNLPLPLLNRLKPSYIDRKYAPWQSTADSLRFWDVESGAEQFPVAAEQTPTMVPCVAWLQRRETLAAASQDGDLWAWDMTARQRVAHFHLGKQPRVEAAGATYPPLVLQNSIDRKGPAPVLAFSPDGSQLATVDRRGVVQLWDTGDWHEQRTLRQEHADPHCLAFSPDGATLAVNHRGQIKLWDPKSGQLRFELGKETDSTVLCGEFSPDGQALVLGKSDGSVRWVDVARRTFGSSLVGHVDSVASLAFSPDGKTLATGGWDATVRLWNVVSRREVAVLEGHRGKVHAVAFSPDGMTLASGGEITEGLGELFLWHAPRDTRRGADPAPAN